MEFFHLILCFLLLFSSFCVSIAKTSIESVLFLILVFFNASISLFLFKVDFLGLIFVIIYVGAIAVLFLFIVMMLQTKINVENISIFSIERVFTELSLIGFINCIFFSMVTCNFFFYKFKTNKQEKFMYFYDHLNNIDIMGQMLYNNYLSCVLFSGLILLIALLGCIVLTVRFGKKKYQMISRQLSRTESFLTFLK